MSRRGHVSGAIGTYDNLWILVADRRGGLQISPAIPYHTNSSASRASVTEVRAQLAPQSPDSHASSAGCPVQMLSSHCYLQGPAGCPTCFFGLEAGSGLRLWAAMQALLVLSLLNQEADDMQFYPSARTMGGQRMTTTEVWEQRRAILLSLNVLGHEDDDATSAAAGTAAAGTIQQAPSAAEVLLTSRLSRHIFLGRYSPPRQPSLLHRRPCEVAAAATVGIQACSTSVHSICAASTYGSIWPMQRHLCVL